MYQKDESQCLMEVQVVSQLHQGRRLSPGASRERGKGKGKGDETHFGRSRSGSRAARRGGLGASRAEGGGAAPQLSCEMR